MIAELAQGDARACLNILELAASISDNNEITKREIEAAVQQNHLHYDKNGEEHYNIISAFHKSMRDSDVEAAIYWCMRMVICGEDPKYIARRMIRFASEDIGNSDPQALVIANATKEAVIFLGYPECDTALVQCAAYLAKAPKGTESYLAVKKAKVLINETGALPVPLIMRNATTKLMKNIDYGKD